MKLNTKNQFKLYIASALVFLSACSDEFGNKRSSGGDGGYGLSLPSDAVIGPIATAGAGKPCPNLTGPADRSPDYGTLICSGNKMITITLPTTGVSLVYNSLLATQANNNVTPTWSVGQGWNIDFDRRFQKTGSFKVFEGSGGVIPFREVVANSRWESDDIRISENWIVCDATKCIETTKDGIEYEYSTFSDRMLLSAVVDRNGNRTAIVREPAPGFGIETVTDSWGHILKFNYASSLLTEVVDFAGKVYKVTRSGAHIAEVEYPNQPNPSKWKMLYAPSTALIAAIVSPEGESMQYRYFQGGEILSEVNQKGWAKNYFYYPDLVRTRFIFETYTEQFDANGLLVMVNDNGQATTFARAPHTYSEGSSQRTINRVISMTSPIGEVTSYTYKDGTSLPRRLNTITDHSGAITEFVSYDDATSNVFSRKNNVKVLKERKSANEIITVFAWNDFDQPASVSTNGIQTTFTYDTNGNLTAVTDPSGFVTSSATYDTQGKILSQTDAYNNVTQYDYFSGPPGANYVRTITDPLGRVTTFERDVFGRPLKITSPDSMVTTTEYNSIGQVEGTSKVFKDTVPGRSFASVVSRTRHSAEGNPLSQLVQSELVDGVEMAKRTESHSNLALPIGVSLVTVKNYAGITATVEEAGVQKIQSPAWPAALP